MFVHSIQHTVCVDQSIYNIHIRMNYSLNRSDWKTVSEPIGNWTQRNVQTFQILWVRSVVCSNLIVYNTEYI